MSFSVTWWSLPLTFWEWSMLQCLSSINTMCVIWPIHHIWSSVETCVQAHFAVPEDRHDGTLTPNLLDSPLEIETNIIPSEGNHDCASMPELPGSPLEDNHDDSSMQYLLGSKLEKSYKRVVIHIQNIDTNDIFELIPWEMMQGSLPKPLVEGHLHWLNLSTSIIEIRPKVDGPWTHSSHNWTTHLQPGQSHIVRRHEFLMAKQSQT